jgi:hypothetical protein
MRFNGRVLSGALSHWGVLSRWGKCPKWKALLAAGWIAFFCTPSQASIYVPRQVGIDVQQYISWRDSGFLRAEYFDGDIRRRPSLINLNEHASMMMSVISEKDVISAHGNNGGGIRVLLPIVKVIHTHEQTYGRVFGFVGHHNEALIFGNDFSGSQLIAQHVPAPDGFVHLYPRKHRAERSNMLGWQFSDIFDDSLNYQVRSSAFVVTKFADRETLNREPWPLFSAHFFQLPSQDSGLFPKDSDAGCGHGCGDYGNDVKRATNAQLLTADNQLVSPEAAFCGLVIFIGGILLSTWGFDRMPLSAAHVGGWLAGFGGGIIFLLWAIPLIAEQIPTP